jgi:hypothetical protein
VDGRSIRALVTARVLRFVGLTVACMWSVAGVSAADARAEATVEAVSGETLKKKGFKSLADGQILFADGSSLSVDDVRVVRFADAATNPSPSPTIVHLSGGGRLPIREAVLVDDACEVTLRDDRKAKLSLEDVAAIQWTESAETAWKDSLARPSAEHDLVVLKAQPQATAVRAFVEAIGTETVEFDWDKQTRTVQRSQVIGVVFARAESSPPAKVRLWSTAGAIVPVTRIDWSEEAGRLKCTLSHGSVIELPAGELVSIHVRSSRVKELSEMTPARVTERPIAALPRSWKADSNVRGEPLKAGSQTFDQGIGAQSGTSLAYELDGDAEQFVAILALDSPPGIAGDCEFVVLADGQEVIRRHLKSEDEPAPVRVPLKGARQLELRVDYGSNLDFGDHANWCDAHLVLRSRPVGAL